jgi:FKBP-type peptidyl-prolyl cis-trans isomerase (trigger factor)
MPIAKNRAKFNIIITRIAQQENLEPTEEEIEAKLKEYAIKLNAKPEELERLKDNSLFLLELIKEKTMDWLLKNAKIE